MVDMLLDEVDRAAKEADVSIRRSEIERVVGKLQDIWIDNPIPLVSYALGYALYAHPDRLLDESISRAVDEHFNAVLDTNPDDALAWLYLGHNAYDLGRFDIALALFRKVEEDSLPGYLALKTREMLLCCRILQIGLVGAIEEVELFVAAAEGMAAEDIWPSELARVLRSQLDGVNPPIRERLTLLFERLDRSGRFGTWFSELLVPSRNLTL